MFERKWRKVLLAYLYVLGMVCSALAGAQGAGARTYKDPQGRFTVPVPTNWTAEAQEGLVTLADPSGELRVYLTVVARDDPQPAIAGAWQQAKPDFALEPTQVLRPPSEPGIEETVVTNYEGDETLYQGFGQLYRGEVYVLLVDAELAAFQRRSAQLNIVASGFEIANLEVADLQDAVPRPVNAEVIGELEAFTREALRTFGLPGAVVGVVQGGEVVYLGGFGTRGSGQGPLTPDTRMMVGSTGKSLTTLLMASLVDEGVMDWDTPVREVLPEFEVADEVLSETMTLRNLVCACTGVPRRDLELFFNANELSAEGIIASLGTFEFFTAFGEAFQYSNQLVAAGGYAAAAADGARYGALLEGYTDVLGAHVLEPIGMTDTTLSFAEVRASDDVATPHTQTFAGAYRPIPLALERLLLPVAPAGAHWSTARDMARYLQTLLARGVAPSGARIVSEERLLETWEPQVPVSADMDYGLGWFIGDYQGLRLISHGGNTLGFTSDLALLPEKDLGIVVLTNAQGSNAFNEAVRERLFELVFEQEPRVAQTVAFAAEQGKTSLQTFAARLRELDVAEVRPFAGSYQNEALGGVQVTLEGEALMLDVGEFASPLRPIVDAAGQPDDYVFTGPPLAGFPVRLERQQGEPVLVLGQGAVAYTFERVDEE